MIMYQDTKRIRKHRATLNLDDYEQDLIHALVNYTGIDQSELLRTMVLIEARELLLADGIVMPVAVGTQSLLSY